MQKFNKYNLLEDKMQVGVIKPLYPFEKRVAILPNDVISSFNHLVIERGFGSSLGIEDIDYAKRGCEILTRDQIFAECEAIFCLKLLQPEDYDKLRTNQLIVGWTHPTGSGTEFFNNIAVPLGLLIVDLDNINPSLYYRDKKIPIPWIPRDFIRGNSVMAGVCATLHALISYGYYPNSYTNVAILAPGNVSQGAYQLISKFNCNIRLFYRKTMDQFFDTIVDYDIIINGIEVDQPDLHIINKEQLKKLKKGTLIIDAAADAGNAIEGTHYTNIGDPIYEEDGIAFYEVNNAPTILYRESSKIISESLSKWVFSHDFKEFYQLI